MEAICKRHRVKLQEDLALTRSHSNRLTESDFSRKTMILITLFCSNLFKKVSKIQSFALALHRCFLGHCPHTLSTFLIQKNHP